MSQRISTEELRTQIDDAIRTLIPLFKVTKEELSRFKKPEIKRTLEPSEYPEHPRSFPAHSALDNFLYFPEEFVPFPECPLATFYHEAGHYVHHLVSPSLEEGLHTFLRTGDRPLGHYRLCELVAEYGNFILGLRDYENDISAWTCFRKDKKIYDKHGPEFLPRLARMGLEEVIKEKIIKV